MQFLKPIFLTGLPGCGKSTLGRALSRHLGLDFIDLDLYIENRRHKSIADIFAERGEEGFRQLESEMLREVASFSNVVVACGGGTPVFADNMDLMNSSGLTVWLQASDSTLVRRLMAARSKRPGVAQISTPEEMHSYVALLHARRDEFYNKAQLNFGSDELENRKMIDTAVRRFTAMKQIEKHLGLTHEPCQEHG